MFDSIYYKGTSKSLLLSDIVLCIHQFQMKGDLILYVVYIVGTGMTQSVIDILSRRNNLGGMMRGANQLKFDLVDVGAVGKFPGLQAWLRAWRMGEYQENTS